MATTQDLVNYYASLLILQYKQKPKALAHVKALVTPVLLDQLPLTVQNAFSLTSATGVQLDTIGKYIGVKRSGATATLGTVTLSDADYLTFLLFGLATNSAGSSLATIQALLAQYFPNQVLVFDYQNMQLSYMIASSIGSQALVQLLLRQGLLPRPTGVSLASTVYAAVITNFFGFRTYLLAGYNNKPLNSYASYNMTWPMLSYNNLIPS